MFLFAKAALMLIEPKSEGQYVIFNSSLEYGVSSIADDADAKFISISFQVIVVINISSLRYHLSNSQH